MFFGNRWRTATESSCLFVLRHLEVTPWTDRTKIAEAVALCLDIGFHQAENEEQVVKRAAQVAVVLNGSKPPTDALVSRFGAEAVANVGSLRRVLRLERHLISATPTTVDLDAHLFDSTPIDEFGELVRLADLVNDGLASADTECRVEAIALLRELVIRVSKPTGIKIFDILLEATQDEKKETVCQFVVACVWEIAFLLPHLAYHALSPASRERGNGLWETLGSDSAIVRCVSYHSALRFILYSRAADIVTIELLNRIARIYASGEEKDSACLEMMYHFFERCLGKELSHENLVVTTVLRINREGYLNGVPLPPATLSTRLSQKHPPPSEDEVVLRRLNKLLVSTLAKEAQNRLVHYLRSMLQSEFSTEYTAAQVAATLGLATQ